MEPRTLTYRKAWWGRAFFLLVSLIGFINPLGIWLEMGKYYTRDYGAFVLLVLYNWGVCVLFFWLSGPDDLYLDLEQRTYCHVKGWPLFPKTRTGPVLDFWGIYVGRTQGSSRYFCVGVTWWGSKGSVILKRFSSKMHADRFAASLMSNLELKQVMPPRNLRPRA